MLVPELDKICEDFWIMLNQPNCIGAIDGKHISIERPSKTVSEFNGSIVLLAACDANYSFTYIDVGTYGSQSDKGIPEPKRLPNSQKELPCYFVADASFPLHINIMKPFSESNTSEEIEYYNNKISEVRRVIENSWYSNSSMENYFTNFTYGARKCGKNCLACIFLHNFLLSSKKSKDVYVPPQFVDWINNENNIENGSWRSQVKNGLSSILPSQNQNTYEREQSTHIGNQLCSFVNEEGKIK